MDADGCPLYRFAQDNFSIEVTNESCRSSNDGAISIIAANTSLNYTATLTGSAVNHQQIFTDTLAFNSLQAGVYTLCITGTDGVNTYEESCFNITIAEPEELQVSSSLNQQNLTVRLDMQGSNLYTIELNGVVTQTNESVYDLPLVAGVNEIKVFGDLLCQGQFSELIVLDTNAALVPNPVVDEATLVLPGFSGNYTLAIFSYDGRLVQSQRSVLQSQSITLNVSTLPQGYYFVKVTTTSLSKTFKFLKR